MRKKRIYGAMLLLAAAMLTGCGDGEEQEASFAEAAVLEGEPLLSDLEREIMNYELKYHQGGFAGEDYSVLAGLYGEAGLIRKQRDMLEESYRLYQDEAAFETLQELAVHLAEEEPEVQEQAGIMYQNLELPEYRSEAIHLLETEEWEEMMMPKLYRGRRNYFLEKEGRIVLSMRTGYREDGIFYSHIWYYGTDNQVLFLKKEGKTLQLLTTGLSEGIYDGPFESWTIDGRNGSLARENGVFAKGVLTGEYTVAVYAGQAPGTLYDLWNNKEGVSYTLYKGSFDAEGKSALEQPPAKELEKLSEGTETGRGMVYAYGENEKDVLLLPLAEDESPAGFVFGSSWLGAEAAPAFALYQVKPQSTPPMEQAGFPEGAEGAEGNEEAAEEGSLQVRIYDGQVQYYDGKIWADAGDVKELAEKDPFRAYEKEKEAYLAERENGREDSGENSSSGNSSEDKPADNRFYQGNISRDKPKAPAETKPSGNKPAGSKPAGNKPAGGAQDSGSNSDPAGNSGTGNSAPPADNNNSAPPSQPQTPPAPPSQPQTPPTQPETPPPTPEPPAGGNDVDIEWSPDIM